MSISNDRIKRLTILREDIALDFVNTVGWHASDHPFEWLERYNDLLNWSVLTGVLTEKKKDVLIDLSTLHPIKAEEMLERIKECRETMYRLIKNRIVGEKQNREDLVLFNSWVKRTYGNVEIQIKRKDFNLEFSETEELDQMIWPVIMSAINLLTSKKKKIIKECEGGTCGWLFIDTSRNKSRRWCSMEDCGNRAKAKRHYQKKKISANSKEE